VAPLPGRNTVGIELPNENRAAVRLKELIVAARDRVSKAKLPLLLGKDSEGRPLIHDLADMPHLLIAGRTGTGKSVCLNSIILSLLLTRTPDECRLLMIDPKQVELAEYGKLPHLMHPVVTDNSKAEAILAWAVDKMEERYELMRKSRVRNIAGFNELGRAEVIKRFKPIDDAERDMLPDRLPYIVIIVDEVGDLMMAMKKEVEGHIIRLAQKSRAAGIHLILTTQRPTVDVITGLIKSNLPARICFQVADRSNSRVVLDEVGAERLLGKGDMLFLQPNTSTIVRAQGSYASDQEIMQIVGHLEVESPQYDNELLHLENRNEGEAAAASGLASKKRDPLYDQAVEIVVREGRGSVSLLQRALGIGYGRSARLIDFMAEDGIVGTYNGAQARDVLISAEQWAQMRGSATVDAE
jgi:S-DNA-T family DNA segregation ATPase FtsK/SpoIIIE